MDFLNRITVRYHKSKQLIVSASTFLFTVGVPVMASADITDTAKSAGGKVYTILMIFAGVLAAISLGIAAILHATGSREGVETGKKRGVKASLTIAFILCASMLFGWIYQTVVASGGGININWPF